MKLVCLDNNILIWGVRRKATPGQEDNIRRAVALFESLDESDAAMMVPTPVVSEFLAAVPKDRHTELLTALQRRFQLVPFDTRMAAIAASIWRDKADNDPNWRDEFVSEIPDLTRVRIKADIQILATALARKAEILYTHDQALARLSEGKIQVRELPPPPAEQGELPLQGPS